MHRVHGILVVALGVVWASNGLARVSAQEAPRGVIPPPNHSLSVLKQNWPDQEARWFYNAVQGSRLLPYKWFLHLEQGDSAELFRSEQHIRALGYLPRRADSSGNEDGLPVGFTRDGSNEASDGDKAVYLGLTCAACHTGQVQFHGKAWLIDGAPTLGNVDLLQRTLVLALQATLQKPDKFDRFFAKVVGTGGAAEKDQLKADLKKWIAIRRGYLERNHPNASATAFGPGRVDAFGAILNEGISVQGHRFH